MQTSAMSFNPIPVTMRMTRFTLSQVALTLPLFSLAMFVGSAASVDFEKHSIQVSVSLTTARLGLCKMLTLQFAASFTYLYAPTTFLGR